MVLYAGQLGAQLRSYQTLGASQGQANRPSSNALTPDQQEIKLEADAKHFMIADHAGFLAAIAATEKQLATTHDSLVHTQSQCDALLSESGLREDIAHRLIAERHTVVTLRERELRLLSDLNGYRTQQGITHTAHYPSDRLLHLSWIFLCMAIETVVNAFFFENQNGLLGGAVVALAVSVVNLGLAGVLGYFFRYKNHKDATIAVLGWASLLVFFLETIYLNGVFSTFRYEYQLVADPTDIHQTTAAFKAALAKAVTVFHFSIPFNDILSFVLFFIGCLLSGYAFYKGYMFDDPYPGFGARDRRHKEAADNATAGEADVRNKIAVYLGQKKTEANDLRTSILAMGRQIAELDRAVTAAVTDLKAALDRIQAEFALVMGTYRRSNASVRSTPAPTYFAETADLKSAFAENESQRLRSRIAEAQVAFTTLRDSYLNRLADRGQDLSRDGAQILGPQLTDFFAEVLRIAQANIAAEAQTIDSLAVHRT
jgi:hypothetical protein